jgi:putative DNA primase/helicase
VSRALSWDPDVIDQALPTLAELGVGANGNGGHHTSPGEPPVNLSEGALRVWRGEDPKLKDDGGIDRSATLVKIGRVEYDAGATRPAIVASLAERDRALGYNKFAGRADAEQRYHEIVDALETSGRNGRAKSHFGGGTGFIPSADTIQSPAQFPHTDMGNAERLVARHGHHIRYCFRWKCWLVYNGVLWAQDDGGAIRRLAKDTVRSIYAEAEEVADPEERKATAKHAIASEKEARVNSMIALARSEVEIAHSQLDTDIYALNVENGTVDLRTGELRTHNPKDYITKVAGTCYDPQATAAIWERHLERILKDKKVREFVQRACGHSFSGDVTEDALFIPYGIGGNGKTVTYEALLKTAGDYGMSAAPDLLLSKDRTHPTEQADLFGARLVVAMEAEEGRRLAESLVKRLTGGDKIKARRMNEDFWEFPPTHKFHMSVNHKPEIRGTDEGIWRRVKLIPFTESISEAEKDKKLDEKLAGELPGILAWAVRGCVAWYQDGLSEPQAVTEATREYRSQMDTLAAFVEERCVAAEDAVAPATKLYKQYESWCLDAGEKQDTQKMFGMRLRERGFKNAKITSGPHKDLKGWFGIGIRADHPDPDEPSKGGDGSENSTNSVAGSSQDSETADDRPPGEIGSFAGHSHSDNAGADDSGAKSDRYSLVQTTRETNAEKSSAPSAPSAPASYDLAPGESSTVKELWMERQKDIDRALDDDGGLDV